MYYIYISKNKKLSQEHSESAYLPQGPTPQLLLKNTMIKISIKNLLNPDSDQDNHQNQKSSVLFCIVNVS